MPLAQEAGSSAILVSLGGYIQKNGRGRIIDFNPITLPAAGQQVLGSNPKRVSAIIQNVGSVIVYACWSTAALGLYIYPGQSLQIDANFPWTGEVFCIGAGGVATPIQVSEVYLA